MTTTTPHLSPWPSSGILGRLWFSVVVFVVVVVVVTVILAAIVVSVVTVSVSAIIVSIVVGVYCFFCSHHCCSLSL